MKIPQLTMGEMFRISSTASDIGKSAHYLAWHGNMSGQFPEEGSHLHQQESIARQFEEMAKILGYEITRKVPMEGTVNEKETPDA